MTPQPQTSPTAWTQPEFVSLFGGAEGTDFLADIATAFREDVTRHLRAIRRAIGDSNFELVRAEAQAIAGVACQMGATVMYAIGRDLASMAAEAPVTRLNERMDVLDVCFEETYRAMLDHWVSAEAK